MGNEMMSLDDVRELEFETDPPAIEFDSRLAMEIGKHGKDISKVFMEEVHRIYKEANKWQEWALLELRHWQDRCHELEIELMQAQSEYPEPTGPVEPKRNRGLF